MWKGRHGICQVTFQEDVRSLPETLGYGIKYNFQLEDAIDGCDEFLISIPLLRTLAEEAGLRMTEVVPFKDYQRSHWNRQSEGLWHKMGVEGLSEAEKEVIGLYSVFAFEKTDGGTDRKSVV